ncbi:biosynthetic-type acetolactate synthase large subunit [Blattabacterium cuenoti]|uniref:biosynthetic-type acetolactate synthase large subunit n=1 Tax=Blattabacterium cuenoti TaxID=1653831 RepID=UPI00163CC381|nr:biosynthetic-type acetolactate synthase large subunit [Blattabacterium cuenoti]
MTIKKEEELLGSEIVIKTLLHEKVKYIFGYPGGAIMPIYDSLHNYLNVVSHILMRHEQGAIHAAQGYARATGKIGVCFTTSGPGATNLITGLADALIDSTPIVCITGQVSSALLGTDAFQETNIIDISIPVTKWNTQILNAKDIFHSIQKGFLIAKKGRPGPVLIEITKDAQFQKYIFNQKNIISYTEIKNFRPYPYIQEKYIKQAANLINTAQKPLVIVGQGVILAKAEYEFTQFIEKTGIPVASTLLGLSILESCHPLYVGMLGMHGNYAPNILTNQCDLLIAIGMRFDDRVTGNVQKYATQAKIIHLEIDPYEINKNILCHIPILGDCKVSLKKLIYYVNKSYHKTWISQFYKLRKKEEIYVIQEDLNPLKKGITMGEVMKWINKYKQKDSILVTDVGQHQMIASRYFNFSCIRSNITSGGLGTMGFALPASIGAKLGYKNRQVICIVGDGGIQMTIQEMGTILQNKISISIILLNNNFLGMVRQWQQLFFKKRYSCTKLINPDFIKLANAYNIKAKKIDKRNQLESAVKETLNYKQSFLLEIIIEKENNVFPMIPSGAAVDEIRLT